jgi:hypothetical protein
MCDAFPFQLASHDLSKIALSPDIKNWLGLQYNKYPRYRARLAERFNLKLKNIERYSRNLRTGKANHSMGGKPTTFDATAEMEIVAHLTNRRTAPKPTEFNQYLQEAAVRSAKRQGVHDTCAVSVSQSTISRFQKKHGIVSKLAEPLTSARASAERDFLNFMSFIALMSYVSQRVKAQLWFNMDGTTFESGGECGQLSLVKCLKSDCHGIKYEPDPESFSTKFYVKYYCVISAFGDIAPPLFVLQSPNMEAGKYDQMTLEIELGQTVHIVFCKSRGCDASFHEWFNIEYILPWIDKIRQFRGFEKDEPAMLQLDGEAVQINAFQNESIKSAFDKKHVIVAKSPPMLTHKLQPCDVGNIFRGAKAKKINAQYVMQDTVSVEKVEKIIKYHEGNYPACKFQHHIRKQMVPAILQAYWRIKTTVTSVEVIRSWGESGIYPLDNYAIIRKCTDYEKYLTHFTDFPRYVNACTKEFSAKGWLSDEFALKLMPFLPQPEKNRDKSAVSRMRACLVTHKKFRVLVEERAQPKPRKRSVQTVVETVEAVEAEEAVEEEVQPVKRARRKSATTEPEVSQALTTTSHSGRQRVRKTFPDCI